MDAFMLSMSHLVSPMVPNFGAKACHQQTKPASAEKPALKVFTINHS